MNTYPVKGSFFLQLIKEEMIEQHAFSTLT